MSNEDGRAVDGETFLGELEEIRERLLGDRPLRDRPRLTSKEAIAAARRERHRGGSSTVNRNFERYLGVPEPEVRRKQLRKLIDEAGEDLFGGETPAHSTLDRQESKAFGVTDEELDRLSKEDALPEAIVRTGWWISVHREAPWPFGIGSALVGEGEKLNPKRAKLRLEELERNRKAYVAMGVEDIAGAMVSDEIHSVADLEHAMFDADVIRDHVNTAELQDGMRKVFTLTIHKEQYDRL